MKAGEYAQLSIEVGHVYLGELEDPTLVAAAASAAAFWIKPVLDKIGRDNASICLMIDDYFPARGAVDPNEAAPLFISAFEEAGLALDYVAHEADFAEFAEDVRTRIQPQPRLGELSFGEPGGFRNDLKDANGRWLRSGWISNGDPIRAERGARDGFSLFDRASTESDAQGRPEHRTSMALEVQIYDSPKGDQVMWSCPFLAACWQLVRLGALRDENNEPRFPARVRQLRDNAPSFHARRTLTLLPPSMLRVEHAVRVILSQLDLDQRFVAEQEGIAKHLAAVSRKRGKGKPGEAPTHRPYDINESLAYVFADERFHEALRGGKA